MGCVNEKPKRPQKPLAQDPSKVTSNVSAPPAGANGNTIQSNIQTSNINQLDPTKAANPPTSTISNLRASQDPKVNLIQNKSPSKLSDKVAVSYDASAQKNAVQNKSNLLGQSDIKNLPVINQTSVKKQGDSTLKQVKNQYASGIKSGQYEQYGQYGSNYKQPVVNVSGYRSTMKQDGYVPQDSLMDYGQTTIEDLNKIQVNFHV